MKNLKTILLFSIFALYLTFSLFKDKIIISKIDIKSPIRGVVTNIEKKHNYYRMYIKSSEVVIIKSVNHIEIGSKIEFSGKYIRTSNNNFNSFNYENYLNSNKIYHYLEVTDYKITSYDNFYLIKNNVYTYLDKSVNIYVKNSLLGTKDRQEDNNFYIVIYTSFLFHFIKIIYYKIFNKFEYSEELFLFVFLVYGYLGSFTFSLSKFFIYNLLLFIVKKYRMRVDDRETLLITFLLMLVFNLNLFLNEVYLISFIISYLNKFKSKKMFIYNILLLIPLYININYNINVLEFGFFLLNSFISILIFILCLTSLIFKEVGLLVSIVLKMINDLYLRLDFIKIIFVFKKVNILYVYLYYFALYLIMSKQAKLYYYFILLIIHLNLNLINKETYMSMIDVGQGDSIFINYRNEVNFLIDTGGSTSFDNSQEVINYLYSEGIKKIDYLILTHGDTDHMFNYGEVMNNFIIRNTFINSNELSEVEKTLKTFKKIDNHLIEYKELKFDMRSFRRNNENDSSIISFVLIDGYKLLLMGDVSSTIELLYCNKYDIGEIDVLKVAHHGSKTSSNHLFIKKVNPKISLISVGRNNIYGHPNKDVLDVLIRSKIYRTDEKGMIKVYFKKEKILIKGNNKK